MSMKKEKYFTYGNKSSIIEIKGSNFEDGLERYVLEPKTLFYFSLKDSGILPEFDVINDECFVDRRPYVAYTLLENRFRKNGYLKDKPKCDCGVGIVPSQFDLFKSAIADAKISATEHELEVAYELFGIMMKEHGHTIV